MWFRVDDKLHSHLKVSRVRRSDPEKVRDIAPMGLWVLAGSWSSAYNTGGFVPTEQLLEWDDNAEVYADRLAKAGLWVRAVQDGHEGYKFHDWADLNPLNSSASGSFGNHLRWHVNRNLVEADCAHCQSSGRVAPDIAPDSGQRRGESSTQPNPTQPNPTQYIYLGR